MPICFAKGKIFQMKKLTVFTDGASRGNPGLSGYGFIVTDDKGQTVKEGYGFLGETTNNVAEYTAVLEAFKFIKEHLSSQQLEINVFADSRLIVEQFSGRFKIKKPHLQELFAKIRKAEESFNKVSFTHVPREQNKIADRLANLGIDHR